MTTTYLRHYTDLSSAIALLSTKSLTLLSPTKWDDKNDAHYLMLYKKKKHLKTVLAACFTQTNETYHHWKIYASHHSGVCIVFDKDKLLADLATEQGLIHNSVTYKTIGDQKATIPEVNDLPFVKRSGYRGEEEFRVIFRSSNKSVQSHSVPISVHSISRVVLSPWLPKPLRQPIVSLLRSIDGCKDLEVTRSTLIESNQWKELGEIAR